MHKVSYFLEIWLRDDLGNKLKDLSIKDNADYHPHITLVRPFYLRDSVDEDSLKQQIIGIAAKRTPISFSLEGSGSFEDHIHYVPVVKESELLDFDSALENGLGGFVSFYTKLASEKNLHVTVNRDDADFRFARVDAVMNYLTVIRSVRNERTQVSDKKVWFAYDLGKKEVLSRKEFLDKKL